MRKTWIRVLLVVVLVMAVAYLAGPRVDVDTTIRTPDLPDDLDAYLAASEAEVGGITPGAEKRITWAGGPGDRTEWAVVYLHGFSATRQETAPLAAIVASRLGANLYETRFTGHGTTGEDLANASVNDWLNDTWEAYRIGQRLGERILVLGVSTGGTAATWLAARPGVEDVVTVLVSPNYGPVDGTSEILTWPWARQIAETIIGPERSFETRNDDHARYWTSTYPTRALLPMMGLVKLARNGDLGAISTPLLVIASPFDQVVSFDRTAVAYGSWGGDDKRLVEITDSQDPDNHVLAGDIIAPDDTDRIAAIITEFVAG